MSARTFSHGDEVFSLHGEAGRYIARVANGHIVEPLFDPEDHEDAPHYADPVTWREVFAKPPTQRLHTEIGAQEEVLENLRQQIEDLRAKRREFEENERATRDRLKRHEQLAHIDDILEGRITHVLVKRHYHGPFVLRTFDEFIAVDANGSDRKLIPLLVLAAKPGTYNEHGDHWWSKMLRMEWHTTTDGSFEDCWLFPSLDLAKEAAAKLLLAEAAAARKDSPQQVPIQAIARIVDNMKSLGINVPADLLGAWTLFYQRDAESKLAGRRKEAAKAQDEVAKAEAAARSIGVRVEEAV